MFDSDRKRSAAARQVASTNAPTRGKQTLVDVQYAIQRKAATADAGEPSDVHAAAARGVATPESDLPHGATIQQLFGRHDVSGVGAHVGGTAAASARDMGRAARPR